jgi:hypothetical protein
VDYELFKELAYSRQFSNFKDEEVQLADAVMRRSWDPIMEEQNVLVPEYEVLKLMTARGAKLDHQE